MSWTVDRCNDINSGIINIHRYRIYDWVPLPMSGTRFGIFGGVSEQRAESVIDIIAKSYGRQGVIVIHGDDTILNQMNSFRHIYGGMIDDFLRMGISVETAIIGSRSRDYNPFYGMTNIGIINAIYPYDSNDTHGDNSKRTVLMKYLKIVDDNDMLVDLKSILEVTSFNIDELERLFLQVYSPDERLHIRQIFTNNNCYLAVRDDIRGYVNGISGILWDDQTEETANTMIGAVENKGIIYIKPGTRKNVINYLAAELKDMIDNGLKFTLIIDSVNINDTDLYNILSLPNVSCPVYISGESPNVIMGDSKENVTNIIGQMNRITVLRCRNVEIARQFSEMIGDYLRIFETKGKGTGIDYARSSFFASSSNRNTGQSKQLFNRIRPESFLELENGAILFDQDTGDIFKVKRYD